MTEENIKYFYDEMWAKHQMNPVHRLAHEQHSHVIKEMFSQREVGRTLVIGTGKGKDLYYVLPLTSNLIATDISESGLSLISLDVNKCCCDANFLPFQNETFDFVLICEVLEHIIDPVNVVEEIYRVLVRGGAILVTTPNWRSLFGLTRKSLELLLRRPFHDGNQPVDNWFTKKRLRIILDPYFEIKDIRGYWHFPPTGRGSFQLPYFITIPLIKLFMGLDRFIGKNAPGWGYDLAVLGEVKK